MKKIIFVFIACLYAFVSFSQTKFEEPKNNKKFDSLKVSVGGDFAMQFQAIKQSADSQLVPLGNGVPLPTANFNINANLAQGIKVNLETYLSARHHNEAWVKGGYFLIDALPFLHLDAVDNLMKYITIKVGVMETNFGDSHFRRSDNGNVINNNFVGNTILEAFQTASAAEVYFRNPMGIIAMAGLTNGIVNQSITGWSGNKFYPYSFGDELAYYTKLGYDKKVNDDLRIRATFGYYLQDYSHQGTIYAGDRGGTRYYLAMNKVTGNYLSSLHGRTGASGDVDIKSQVTNSNWGPGSVHNITAANLNLFVKYKGIELFGLYETCKGVTQYTRNVTNGRIFKFNQIEAELLFRFGKDEQFYVGGKYNTVTSKIDPLSSSTTFDDQTVTRVAGALGWYLNKYTVFKIEYVDQKYKNFNTSYSLGGLNNNFGSKAGFSGLMFEAGISF